MNVSNFIVNEFKKVLSGMEKGEGNFPFRKKGTDTYLRGAKIPFQVDENKILDLWFVEGKLFFPGGTGFYTNPVSNIFGADNSASRRMMKRLEARIRQLTAEIKSQQGS